MKKLWFWEDEMDFYSLLIIVLISSEMSTKKLALNNLIPYYIIHTSLKQTKKLRFEKLWSRFIVVLRDGVLVNICFVYEFGNVYGLNYPV